ncbi:MAG TPA: cytidine deaminase [Candidatus Elarobacter sp.]|nr:cytidine deaminase [Candidatus Elarobacter sp.]
MTEFHAAVISAADAAALAVQHGRTIEQLMDDLLAAARSKAIAPISGFAVGAVARGRSGALYLGANLEFPGHPLNASVHAEQAAVVNAWMHGEHGIGALATSETPCGHCRQFLNELANAPGLTITVHGKPAVTLGDLLPSGFGPADLGVSAALMATAPQPAALDRVQAVEVIGRLEDLESALEHQAALLPAALEAARRAHAVYSKTYAGVALALQDGTIRTGRYAESAAFNPSLSPLQAALSGLALDGVPFPAIVAAVLVESAGPASQRETTKALLNSVAPWASLTYARAVPG